MFREPEPRTSNFPEMLTSTGGLLITDGECTADRYIRERRSCDTRCCCHSMPEAVTNSLWHEGVLQLGSCHRPARIGDRETARESR